MSQDGALLDERLSAAVQACHAEHRLGHWPAVLQQAPALLGELESVGAQREQRQLLFELSMAAAESARFDIALDAAQRLNALAGRTGSAGEMLRAAFTLAASLERVGDSWQAERVLTEALEVPGVPERDRMVAHNGLAAVLIGAYYRLRGVDGQAEVQALLQRAREHAERALSLLARAADPVYEIAITGNLGELLLHLNHRREARVLLDRGIVVARRLGHDAHRWRVECSLAEWHVASGDAASALALVHTMLAESNGEPPPQTLIRLHHAAYRAHRALDQPAEALSHFEVAERLERARTSAQLRAQSLYFVTRIEAERSRVEAQRQHKRVLELAQRAEQDALTTLGNRHLLERRLPELLAAAAGIGAPLTLATVDIDHFKQVNDTHGHAVGDAVLAGLAQALRENARTSDLIVRLGGEEFLVVYPGMPLATGQVVCDRLRLRIAQRRWEGAPAGLAITVSIGLTSAPPYSAELIERADAALCAAKREGRNRVRVL